RPIPSKFLSARAGASVHRNEPSPQRRSPCNGAVRPKIFSRSSVATYDSGTNSITEKNCSVAKCFNPQWQSGQQTFRLPGEQCRSPSLIEYRQAQKPEQTAPCVV